MNFAIGQRWVSQAENDLGLGTIIQVDTRFVQVLFPAADETRNYASEQAPLMRVEFAPGETLSSLEDFKFVVEHVEEMQNTLIYKGKRVDNGEEVSVKEIMLDHHIKLHTPEARLYTGNFDRSNWFSLRMEAHQHKAALESSHLQGLQGARVSLIPHQLYIADTVGQRFSPRVLLADEVGLGKTIEAGLIIHQQLISGRSQRVLLILPESLQHQWLVEMLRRFNLRFSIFDDQRCEAEMETAGEDAVSPFDSEQLILISQEWLSRDDKWQKALLQSEWDLVVVDEAHHITPENESALAKQTELNQLYKHVQQIGEQTKGLILLTATPDQLGHFGHFSRLQLLDPNRFHDYEKFKQEETHYQQIAEIANVLVSQKSFSDAQYKVLSQLLNDSTSIETLDKYQSNKDKAELAQRLISDLLDRHGTGRIMFRNSRQGIKGFPERKVTPYPLNAPEGYPNQASFMGLQPETQHDSGVTENNAWWNLDPRVQWLCNFLLENKGEKVLVICAHAQTAMKIDDTLFEREGLRSTIFHEGMSIVERDKAAAYFADEENSAQALICSEIGSEGRNFQFAHHLVLFDLPANPDLLEQRIGRLDRIGQTETVKIHVPYLVNSAQENLFNWFHNSFNAFEQTSTTARIVAEEFKQQISEVLLNVSEQSAQEALIQTCQTRNLELKQDVENGRDRLLELNSSGGDKAKQICEQIDEMDDSTELMNYIGRVWDQFGVQQEEKSTFSTILHPGEHMLNDHFPSLLEDGMTVCFDRETALSQEDQHFMSWEHPMVTGVLDMLTSGELGNSSVCLLPHKQLPPGTFLVEASYVLTTSAPKSLQLHRFLPNTVIRLMLDKNGNNLADKVKQGSLDKMLKNAKKQMALQLIKALKDEVSVLIEKSEAMAATHAAQIKLEAKDKMLTNRQQELNRLTALQKVNPAIRDEEINYLQQQIDNSVKEIEMSQVSLDAIRLIVVTQG
ncbi:RNA polymerase-associated protein RapA [Psychrosphaera aquimarina]|uniref:RNA polymerase-associated protein RapA n=1 Tax=Psychrosphaera aquimarina TaxID=2044854 RepID=A0ABU3R095_9GAMM|nr:RNA polymerase-associated protein RapA [Psychrosphaera aquimarina]MDU0113095.1 RNA polymerase-associated protein RapA [Psychrosphaera aquimarina]